ncbi:MAG TPA: hypothetical protein VLA88_04845, partial [Candidatus Saccharimonadales bacterium]|nr:hypothetical protein [Candidatus Saccharimonadales bacterium]
PELRLIGRLSGADGTCTHHANALRLILLECGSSTLSHGFVEGSPDYPQVFTHARSPSGEEIHVAAI